MTPANGLRGNPGKQLAVGFSREKPGVLLEASEAQYCTFRYCANYWKNMNSYSISRQAPRDHTSTPMHFQRKIEIFSTFLKGTVTSASAATFQMPPSGSMWLFQQAHINAWWRNRSNASDFRMSRPSLPGGGRRALPQALCGFVAEGYHLL